MIKTKFNKISWIEIHIKINRRKMMGKIEKLHSWICNHPKVVILTLTNDHVNIKNNTTGETIKHEVTSSNTNQINS